MWSMTGVVGQPKMHRAQVSDCAAIGSQRVEMLKAGRRPQAESIIARLKVEAEKVPELFNDLTVLMFELGDREAGMKFFKSAYERRLLHLAMIEHYPTWEKVKADPEVQRILAEPPPSPPGPSPNPNR